MPEGEGFSGLVGVHLLHQCAFVRGDAFAFGAGGVPGVNEALSVFRFSLGHAKYGISSGDLIGAALGPALPQLIAGSDFLARLNAAGDTRPGVAYTTITTRFDEMIQPHTNEFLRGPGAVNHVIQDLCPANMIGHMNLPYDQFTQDLIIATLDPSAPAPVCRPVALGTGILELMIVSNS